MEGSGEERGDTKGPVAAVGGVTVVSGDGGGREGLRMRLRRLQGDVGR